MIEAACADILEACARGEISPPMALMKLLIETEDDARVGELLAARRTSELDGGGSAPNVFDALLALHRHHRAGCTRIASMLRSGVDSPEAARSVDEGIAFAKRLFDWSVDQSEEASVALYSLGSPEILAEATAEVVRWLQRYGCLGAGARVLDLGCGIGRLEVALAPRVRSIVAIDVSPRMIAVAERRCALLSSVEFRVASGRNLVGLDDDSFDLVLACDSMPYLVQAGMELVEMHFAEAARVLAPGGSLVILNFSYREAPADDARDVAQLAARHGFAVRVDGVQELTLWDARAFLLTRQPAGPRAPPARP